MGGRSESTGGSPGSGAGAGVGEKVARTRPQPSSLEFQMELQSSKHSQHGGRMAQLASHSGSESARPPQSPFNGFFGIC